MTAGIAVARPGPQRRLRAGAGVRRTRRLHHIAPSPIAVATVTAWALLVVAQTTGAARYVDHDAVFSAGTHPAVGWCLFLLGWLLMVVAMMLPTLALPSSASAPPGAFIWGFLLVWVIAGLGALGFDMGLHRAVHALPALEARPWLVSAALLGGVGAVQLAPSTRRHLARCRHLSAVGNASEASAFRAGQEYGTRCLRADGPLMLIMFAAGGRLVWMALLTAVMVGERSSRAGPHVTVAAGVALVMGAVLVVLNPAWLPAPFGVG